jgi:hypothetical protein
MLGDVPPDAAEFSVNDRCSRSHDGAWISEQDFDGKVGRVEVHGSISPRSRYGRLPSADGAPPISTFTKCTWPTGWTD